MHSNFIISLDFELIWGMHTGDIVNNSYNKNIKGGREAITDLLNLFEKYGIRATWAVVGLMFAENVEEAKKYFPPVADQPTYKNINMSPYPLMKTIDNPESDKTLYFASDIIEEISKIPGQEIASHTFSHFYCMEEGQSVKQFEADMKAAKAIATDKGYNLTSVVFPKNQCVKEYIEVLPKLGFNTYRDECSKMVYKNIKPRLLARALRLIDSYFPLSGHGAYSLESDNRIVRVIGSRMLRPYLKPLAFMEKMKIKRIKNQMVYAAKNGLTYHLWWHPHNIGVKSEYHLGMIEEILKYYVCLKKEYGMKSKNMADVAEMCETL